MAFLRRKRANQVIMHGLLLIYAGLLATCCAFRSRLAPRSLALLPLRVTSDRPKTTEEVGNEELLSDSKVFKYGVDVAIAEENMILGNYEDAEKMAQEAMRMAESFSTEGDDGSLKPGRDRIESFKNVYKAFAQGILADAKLKEGHPEAAAELYRSALHRYEAAYQAMTLRSPEALELVGSTQLIAASLLDNETDYDAAVKTCQLALGLTKKLMPPDSREVAYALTNLAKAYLLSGDDSEGPEALLTKAIGLLRYHHGEVSRVSTEQETVFDEEITFENEERSASYLARAYSLLGDLHMARGNLDEAINVWNNFVKSKITFWEEEGVTETEDVDTIDILCKLSVLLFSKDQLMEAEGLARRALWSLELMAGRSNDFTEKQKEELALQISDLKNLLGSIANLKRQEDEAEVRAATGF